MLGAEGFSCSFDTSYAGLGLNILQCFDGKNTNTFSTVIFIIQKVKIALFRSAGCSVLGAEGFSCSFDTSYAGLGLNILQCFDGKNMNTFSTVIFIIQKVKIALFRRAGCVLCWGLKASPVALIPVMQA